ncbi:peptidase [Streptosporangium sp. NPDC051023]|uniref:peptidase n=1 Tax=Streptosporangium sp. NPDC051023 TaxID=3155410 RepID=UPI00344C6A28
MLRRLIAPVLLAGALAPASGLLEAPATAQDSPATQDSPAPGSLGIRLVDAPISSRADPRARRYIVDHLPPGIVIHRRVEVSNTSGAPMPISLYPAAAEIGHGAFRFADGRTANDLTTWTSIVPHALTLAPHSRSMATVTVSVPDDVPAGERYAVIWAETAGEAKGTVREINRTGVRMYLSVGRGGGPPTDFSIDSLTAQRSAGGDPVILAQVHNTGGRALDLSGDLRLTDGPGGMSAGPFEARLGTTLGPGEIEAVTVTLSDQVPDGPWKALVRLRSGLVRRTGQATITFPHDAGTAAAVSTGRSSLETALASALALCVLGFIVMLVRRGRRPATPA